MYSNIFTVKIKSLSVNYKNKIYVYENLTVLQCQEANRIESIRLTVLDGKAGNRGKAAKIKGYLKDYGFTYTIKKVYNRYIIKYHKGRKYCPN